MHQGPNATFFSGPNGLLQLPDVLLRLTNTALLNKQCLRGPGGIGIVDDSAATGRQQARQRTLCLCGLSGFYDPSGLRGLCVSYVAFLAPVVMGSEASEAPVALYLVVLSTHGDRQVSFV